VQQATDTYSATTTNFPTAVDKQRRILEQTDPGHFSMIRALHLADLITLGNGTFSVLCTHPPTNTPRLLRHNVHLLLPPLLSRARLFLRQPLGRTSIHALRSLLRLHGRQSRALEKEVVHDGPRTRLVGGPDQFRRRARRVCFRGRNAHARRSFDPDVLCAVRIVEIGQVQCYGE